MKKIIFIIIAVVIVIAGVIGAFFFILKEEEEQENGNLKIVTSFYPIYIMTANIIQGANGVEMSNLTQNDVGCLHDYTLTTSDMKKIEKADVLIENGLGLENFMDKIITAYPNLKIINSSENVMNKIDDAEGVNAHVWTSLENYTIQVEQITKKLCEINPENSSIYESNKESYLKEVQEIKLKYDTELQNLNGKKVVCLNEALTYLARDLQMDIISVKTNHEESALSADTIKGIIDRMKNEGINTIFIDKDDDLTNAELLKTETGAEIYRIDSGMTGAITKSSYIDAINSNFEILKQIQ